LAASASAFELRDMSGSIDGGRARYFHSTGCQMSPAGAKRSNNRAMPSAGHDVTRYESQAEKFTMRKCLVLCHRLQRGGGIAGTAIPGKAERLVERNAALHSIPNCHLISTDTRLCIRFRTSATAAIACSDVTSLANKFTVGLGNNFRYDRRVFKP
jgi:hypothetical protein